ncbi:MAG: DUF2937 family protein [Thiotrichales bacterium]
MLKILIFVIGALVGSQIPGFIYQYQEQTSDNLNEVKVSLSGFQRTANRFFDGDMNRLIDYYRNSPDRIFRSDADSISQIYTRYADLYYANEELKQMPWYDRLSHILFDRDGQIFENTWHNYKPSFYPTMETGFWAAGTGLLFFLLYRFWLVILLGILGLIFGPIKRKPRYSTKSKSKESSKEAAH